MFPMSKHVYRPAVRSQFVDFRLRRACRPAPVSWARSIVVAALLLVVGSGIGCSRDPGPEDFSTRQTITILKNAATLGNAGFSPNPANVAINTQVLWVNRDTVDHRIVSTAGIFDSGPIRPGQSYQRIFRDAGTFLYYDESPGAPIQGVLNVIN